MQETKLAQGECSHPPLRDDVSDESLSDFSDSNMEYEYYYINSYHGSPIMPKWANKTIQEAGDLVGDPLDPKKTRSQIHNAFSTCEFNISYRCFMMAGYDP